MARPTKLTRAKRNVMRLQVMLRKAEDDVLQFEAMEQAIAQISDAHERFIWLQAKVEKANQEQLKREKGEIYGYNPFADIDALMVAMRHRLRVDSGF